MDNAGPQIDPSTVTPAGSNPLPQQAQEADTGPDLDKLLSQAIDGQEGTEPEARQRDPATGRFAKRPDGEQNPTGAAPQEGTPTEDATKEPAAEAKPQNAPTEGHFRGWSKDDRDAFGKLTPEAQQFVLHRQSANQAHATRVEQEAATFQKTVDPYLDVYRRNAEHLEQVAADLRTSPVQVVDNLIRTEQALRFGSYQEKVAVLSKLASDYGIPFAAPATDPLADPVQPGGEQYPVIHDLQQQIRQLQGQLRSIGQRSEADSIAQVQQHVQSFVAAKGSDGQLLHPHAASLRGAMGELLRSGQATTLEDAYQQALKPINDLVAERLAASQKVAVEKARRAAPVRTSGMAPGGHAKPTNLDDVLNAALDGAGL